MNESLNTGQPVRNKKNEMFYILGVVTLILTGLILFWTLPYTSANADEITVYKTSACGCCGKWVEHLREAGFHVTTIDQDKGMGELKTSLGVTPQLRSCHTAIVSDYIVEGHVPAEDIKRLLREQPDVVGLTTPGMPMGSPGMEGDFTVPYQVLTFDKNGKTEVFANH